MYVKCTVCQLLATFISFIPYLFFFLFCFSSASLVSCSCQEYSCHPAPACGAVATLQSTNQIARPCFYSSSGCPGGCHFVFEGLLVQIYSLCLLTCITSLHLLLRVSLHNTFLHCRQFIIGFSHFFRSYSIEFIHTFLHLFLSEKRGHPSVQTNSGGNHWQHRVSALCF